MPNVKGEAKIKEPAPSQKPNKVGYIIAVVLGLIIVVVLALFFILNSSSFAKRWIYLGEASVSEDALQGASFVVIRDRSDASDYFYDVDYTVHDYNLRFSNDYLLVPFSHDCDSALASISDVRLTSVSDDGTAEIRFTFGQSIFGSYYCTTETQFILMEGKKGSFDKIKKVNLDGAEYEISNNEPPVGPTEYIAEGKLIWSEDGYSASNESYEIFDNYNDLNDYVSKKRGYESAMFSEEDFLEHDYIVVAVVQSDCGGSIETVGLVTIDNGVAHVNAEMFGSCGPCAPEYHYYAIPVQKGSTQKVKLTYETVNEYRCEPDVAYKPVIYLYPTTATDVSVKLGAKEKLLVSYPTYIDGWRVNAQPNGNLTDLDTGRGLYSLYYEAENTTTHGMHDTGFVVKGSDTASFLEAKLAELGLNDREAEEFIIYWLPQMQNNTYNYIHFATGEEASRNMPLDVSPAPKTTIHINMEWKALTAPIKVKTQSLPATPTREGFTLVEWGGTIL